jgi:histidine triad (HIT) family protein
MSCIFCKIIEGEIGACKIWENKDFLVFLSVMPIKEGHLLIIPKKHFEDIYSIPQSLYGDLFNLVKKISFPLQKATNVKRIGLKVEGFEVNHAHVHLVPINKSGELNLNNLKKADEQDLKEVQKKLSPLFLSLFEK